MNVVNIITDSTYDRVVNKIQEIETEYSENQARILTEDDLKCLIFYKLYSIFNHSCDTMDPSIKGSPLHSEIKFFDESDKLLIRPDLTILEPKNLSILHSICDTITIRDEIEFKSTSSKGFEFGYDCIVIEIKFYRGKRGIGKRETDSIKKDLQKIERLKNIARSHNETLKINGIMVVFNKTNKVHRDFYELISECERFENLKIIYGTGNVGF